MNRSLGWFCDPFRCPPTASSTIAAIICIHVCTCKRPSRGREQGQGRGKGVAAQPHENFVVEFNDVAGGLRIVDVNLGEPSHTSRAHALGTSQNYLMYQRLVIVSSAAAALLRVCCAWPSCRFG
jgi:hypothetical protein